MSHEVSEAEVDRAVGDVFGRSGAADVAMVQHFREAGFSEELARQGAVLMESGRYFGFADVASSLAIGSGLSGRVAPLVTEARIQEVAAKLEGTEVTTYVPVTSFATVDGRRVRVDEHGRPMS